MLTTKNLATIQQILCLLSHGEIVSGQVIGEALQMSRTAIWKYIQLMQEVAHIDLKVIPNKGYQLAVPYIALDPDAIKNNLSTTISSTLEQIQCHTSIGSTNQAMLEQIDISTPQHILCLSEMQTAGIGRRGETWQSPFGYNLYLSLLWSFNQPLQLLIGLSILLAIVTADTLKDLGLGDGLQIKWPNDLFYHDKKLGGILLETRSQQGGLTSCVMSLGLNGYLPTYTQMNISQQATSYFDITGQAFNRNQFTVAWLNRLIPALEQFVLHGLKPLMARWQHYDLYYQQPIKVELDDQVIKGMGMGISQEGQLQVQPEDQAQPIQSFHAHQARIIRQH